MQSFKRFRDVLIVLGCAVIPAVSGAERIDGERIVACSKEDDDARRLACYDSVMSSSGTPIRESLVPPSTSGQPTSPPVAPTIPVSNEDEFGIKGSELAKQRRAQQTELRGAPKIHSLSAVVTKVASGAHGIRIVTLDNDQVWRQKTAEASFPVKIGDRVTINAGMLGSHHMTNAKRSTQVTRVK
jgi:hypothetical protein